MDGNINRPMEGRVMLVGLGKRRDRAGQSQEVEQFWLKSTTPVPAGQWADAVFPIKSAEGVDIYSLVVVPHAYFRNRKCPVCDTCHAVTLDWTK